MRNQTCSERAASFFSSPFWGVVFNPVQQGLDAQESGFNAIGAGADVPKRCRNSPWPPVHTRTTHFGRGELVTTAFRNSKSLGKAKAFAAQIRSEERKRR